MALSFDPDWQGGNASDPVALTISDIPDGTAGDVLFLWVLSNRLAGVEPALASAVQSGATTGTMLVETFGEYPTEAQDSTMWVIRGSRVPGITEIELSWSVQAGDTTWILANFPSGAYVLDQDNTHSGDTASVVSTTGDLYAGAVVASRDPLVGEPFLEVESDSTSFEVNTAGGADLTAHTRYTDQAMLSAWALEGAHDVDLAAVGGGLVGSVLHVAGLDSWHVGGVGRSW